MEGVEEIGVHAHGVKVSWECMHGGVEVWHEVCACVFVCEREREKERETHRVGRRACCCYPSCKAGAPCDAWSWKGYGHGRGRHDIGIAPVQVTQWCINSMYAGG